LYEQGIFVGDFIVALDGGLAVRINIITGIPGINTGLRLQSKPSVFRLETGLS
jgi:hypothetical protein